MRVPLIYKDAPQFGFDIGTHTVKIVQLRRNGRKTALQAYGECYFPRDAMAEGIVVDPVEVAKAVTALLKKPTFGKLTASRVIVGLPATKLFTRTLRLPQMDGSDLVQAVQYEVEQYVPVPVSDLYVDHEIINTSEGEEPHMDVLMTAAPRAIVDSYIKLFDVLGLEIGAIEANMTAVVRAMLHSKEAGGNTLIMDIGSVSTDLTIYDQVLPLTGSVPIGGEHLTDTLISKLNIKADQAAEIKTKFGLSPSGMHDKVVSALDPQLSTIVKEVKKVIRFYESRGDKPQKVGQVVLTGGASRMPGLDKYLADAIGLPLSMSNPWKNLDAPKAPSSLAAEGPNYATAVGLALRGLL